MSDLKPVLYAEDDENDVFLMERAFARKGIQNALRVVNDGKLAVAYLAGTAPYQDRAANPVPCLMLLDLSMPGKHGLEVLKWMKSEPSVATVPVVILSSSSQETDIHRAYLLGASGFLVKPGDPDDLIKMVDLLHEYWLNNARPPESFVDFAAVVNIPPPKKKPL